MNGYEKFDKLIEIYGHEYILGELLQALSEKEKQENADYISQMQGIDFEEVDE